MSKFFSDKLCNLKPYVPGEQPQYADYIKLNTNENPYFPSKYAVQCVDSRALNDLRLYSDPECSVLCDAIANFYGIDAKNVLLTNGSDEALAFCFAAYGECGAVFPDVTYGFYKVLAELFRIDYEEKFLDENFNITASDYYNIGKTVFLANPNAQTGIYLSIENIEKMITANKNNVVILDEAYIDFGGKSAVSLIEKYDNLAIVQTFSKSRSLAGARVGFVIANEQLINDLRKVKYSFNPYNVNRISSVVAIEAIKDVIYFKDCIEKIICSREYMVRELTNLGYEVLPSLANFVLVKSPHITGRMLYEKLKAKGILVRHFDDMRIREFVRITVGTDKQTEELIKQISALEREI